MDGGDLLLVEHMFDDWWAVDCKVDAVTGAMLGDLGAFPIALLEPEQLEGSMSNGGSIAVAADAGAMKLSRG